MIPALETALRNPSFSETHLSELEAEVDRCLALHEKAATAAAKQQQQQQHGQEEFSSVVPPMRRGPASAASDDDWSMMVSSPPEAIPEVTVQSCSSNTIHLAWIPPSSKWNIQGYEVRQMGPDNTYCTVYHGPGHVTTCTANDLDGDTRYVFGVRAWNEASAGPWRNCCGSTSAPTHFTSHRIQDAADGRGSGGGFGRSGVLYWIGTREGQDQVWQNPVHTGDV